MTVADEASPCSQSCLSRRTAASDSADRPLRRCSVVGFGGCSVVSDASSSVALC